MAWSRQQELAFVAGPGRIGRLATVSGDGSPHVVPIWYRLDGERVLVHTMAASRKVANIRETGRYSLTADVDDWPYSGVTVSGPAEVVSNDVVDSLALIRELAVEYVGREIGTGLGEEIAALPGEHVALVLHVEETESWDMSGG